MGSSVEIRPLGAKILVRPEVKKESVSDGIVIPEKAGSRGDNRTAFVIATGPAYKGDLCEGSRVIVSPFCGVEIKVGRDVLAFITEKDVLAEIED